MTMTDAESLARLILAKIDEVKAMSEQASNPN
jgi:hypothetical protein